jgi:pimeloyl-ACP methyl ester carboxylesterase
MSYILSKDATLYVEEHGSGETLVLLPGLLGTMERHWRRFIPQFAKRFHVVAVDLRGHGRTNNPSQQMRLHTLVADLFCLFDTLEIESARVCGYSLGGYIGLAFGIRHPGRVHSLLMHGTKFYWTPEAVAATVRDFDVDNVIANVPKWAAQLQGDHAPANGEDGWQTLLRVAQEFIATMPAEGLTENALRSAGFPVMVSAGDTDELVPVVEVQRLARRLPFGTHHIFPAARHPLPKLDTEAFLNLACSFFDSSPVGNKVRED